MTARGAVGERPQPGSAEVVHREPGLAIVEVCGEHDLSTEAALMRALEEAAAHSNVLADLSGCTFADSTALTILIKAAQAAQGCGKRFAVVIPPVRRQVARVAEMIGRGEMLALHPTRDSALEALAVRPGEPA
jgi:anti-anti-sigma factor